MCLKERKAVEGRNKNGAFERLQHKLRNPAALTTPEAGAGNICVDHVALGYNTLRRKPTSIQSVSKDGILGT